MSAALPTFAVAMYSHDGAIWLRTDETRAVSAAKAVNNIRWRWEGRATGNYIYRATRVA